MDFQDKGSLVRVPLIRLLYLPMPIELRLRLQLLYYVRLSAKVSNVRLSAKVSNWWFSMGLSHVCGWVRAQFGVELRSRVCVRKLG